MAEDKRKAERIKLSRPVMVKDSSSGEALGLVVNLSLDGLMLLGDKQVTDGTVLQVELPLEMATQMSLNFGIECLWVNEADTEDKIWSGYRIIDIADETRLKLEQVILSL